MCMYVCMDGVISPLFFHAYLLSNLLYFYLLHIPNSNSTLFFVHNFQFTLNVLIRSEDIFSQNFKSYLSLRLHITYPHLYEHI